MAIITKGFLKRFGAGVDVIGVGCAGVAESAPPIVGSVDDGVDTSVAGCEVGDVAGSDVEVRVSDAPTVGVMTCGAISGSDPDVGVVGDIAWGSDELLSLGCIINDRSLAMITNLQLDYTIRISVYQKTYGAQGGNRTRKPVWGKGF